MRSSLLAASAVDRGVLTAGDAAWAWFAIPTVSYDLLDEGEREGLLAATAITLGGLSGTECHLLAVPERHDAPALAAALDEDTDDPSPGWHDYLGEVTSHVAAADHWQRRVYLGVLLGRARPERGSKKVDEEAGPSRWATKAALLERSLRSSALRARALEADEILGLVQRAFWRGMAEVPQLPTDGSLQACAASTIDNRYRSLLLGQGEETAHLAFLAAAQFPDEMEHPGAEWLSYADALGFPVEVSLRVRLVPPREASADAARKLAEASDQARHIAGTSSDLPLALLEATHQARQLEYAVTKQGLPLAYSWPVFGVAAATASELDGRVAELVDAYRDLGITLARPGGDQLALFCSTLPGDRVRVRAFEQRQALVTLAGGMIQASSEVGDGSGPYIGETTGRSCLPVHFDPLAAARRNFPTAIAITGQPGGGKTHLAKLLLHQMTLRGAWGLMIDPKDEARGFAGLPGLGDVQVLDIGPEAEGILDPFRLAEDGPRGALLAADTLRMLVPGDLDAEHESALLAACRLEAGTDAPSLHGVVDRLEAGGIAAGRLAETLHSVAYLPLARLCFGTGNSTLLTPDRGLTILHLQGLSVPDAGTANRDLTLADRLAMAVMYLVAVLAGSLADASRAHAKAIVIDEAWALTASRQGRALVQRLARTGRSKNTALALVSQNASDFMGPEVQNNFSARFAFRSTQDEEVTAVCRLLGIVPSAPHRQLVRTLANGECVFADIDGRVAPVQIDLVSDALAKAFDTTPAPWRKQPLEPAAGVGS